MRVASVAALITIPMLLQAVFGASTAFGGGAVFLNAQGDDPRQDMTSSVMPWSSIGLIWSREFVVDPTTQKLTQMEDSCTGTLIGKRLVLTAAHCVIKKNADPSLNTLKVISFTPNYQGGVRADTSMAAQEKSDSTSSDTAPSKILTIVGTMDTDHDEANDWAVVVLEDDLGSKYGTMDIESTGKLILPLEVQFAGYSADRRTTFAGASFVNSCEIKTAYPMIRKDGTLSGDLLEHDCSSMEGASGGALFHLKNGKYTIAGINVRGSENFEKGYNPKEPNLAVWNDALINAVQAAKLKYE